MYDLVILGAGPAALSAASYARGKHLEIAVVYDAMGGKVAWRDGMADLDTERRLPGAELVRLLALRLAEHRDLMLHDRATLVTHRPDHFEITTERHGALYARAVIVATGATPLRLSVPGADHLVHHGLGYSIQTFGHLVAGKRVAVVGATVRSLRGAAELARLARSVILIAPSAHLLDTPLAHQLAARSSVELLAGYEVQEVLGPAVLAGLRLGDGSSTRVVDVDHVFVDLGLLPNSDAVRHLVALDERGYIIVDPAQATSVPGIFAAGDVTNLPGEQVLIAAGDGARAAVSAYDYLLGQWLAPTPSNAR